MTCILKLLNDKDYVQFVRVLDENEICLCVVYNIPNSVIYRYMTPITFSILQKDIINLFIIKLFYDYCYPYTDIANNNIIINYYLNDILEFLSDLTPLHLAVLLKSKYFSRKIISNSEYNKDSLTYNGIYINDTEQTLSTRIPQCKHCSVIDFVYNIPSIAAYNKLFFDSCIIFNDYINVIYDNNINMTFIEILNL